MSENKPLTWWESFDHVVMGARRLQADREAKFDNPYGRNRPEEQKPKHTQDETGKTNGGEDTSSDDMHTQDGAGKARGGQHTSPDVKNLTLVDPVDQDDAPQSQEHDNKEELLQDDTLDLGNQLAATALAAATPATAARTSCQQLPNQEPEPKVQDNAEGGDRDDQDRVDGTDSDSESGDGDDLNGREISQPRPDRAVL